MAKTDRLVTVSGATGFIGLHCIQQLLDEGYRVRGTVRSLKKEAQVREALSVDDDAQERLELCEAELGSDAGWPEAFEGASYGLHVASPLPKETPAHEDELIVPAREGTLRVLRAAAAAGVKRVVVTSSFAAVFWRSVPEPHVFTEEDWSDPARTPPYDKSKTLAERAAWDFIESEEAGGMEMATINPVYVVGPSLSGAQNTSNEIVNKLLRREMPGVPKIQFPLVDVRDVAKGHLLAMEKPEAAGKRFILVSDTSWYSEIATTLKESGFDVPTMVLPNLAVRLVALFDKTVRLVLPTLDKEVVASNAQAEEILGWSGRSMREMVIDTAKQFAPQA